MKIHPVTHGPRKNRFCGPAALSALTGRQTDFTAAFLRLISGKRSVMGVDHDLMLRALYKLGYRVRSNNVEGTPTLAGWLKLTPRPAGVVYLVSAGRHYQVISGRRFVDSKTIDIVSVRDERVKRRARVKAAWQVMPAA